MRINSLSVQNNHRMQTPQQTKVEIKTSSSYLPCLSFDKIPSIAFSGQIVKPTIIKNIIPDFIKETAGEFYKIKLFNKEEQKLTDAFLSYEPVGRYSSAYGHDSYDEKVLIIQDKSGNKLGNVNINTSDWQTKSDSEFDEGLPQNYLRLHILESGNNSYAGIGTKLIQAAVEKSMQGEGQGRIYVFACNNTFFPKNDPFVFYNKMGLSITNPYGESPNLSTYMARATNKCDVSKVSFIKEIEKLKNKSFENISSDEKCIGMYEVFSKLKNCRLDEIYLDFNEWMYLPDIRVEKFWKPKIAANPIFSESNRLK